MSDWRRLFLESCCADADGVSIGEGAVRPGPASWVGRREVAHFDGARILDVRLTKPEIRVYDEEWARELVVKAIDANPPSAPSGSPPEGADLARRRRFH